MHNQIRYQDLFICFDSLKVRLRRKLLKKYYGFVYVENHTIWFNGIISDECVNQLRNYILSEGVSSEHFKIVISPTAPLTCILNRFSGRLI